MDKNNTQIESTKLPYHRPTLACYGDVKTLTLNNAKNGAPDNAAPPPFTLGT